MTEANAAHHEVMLWLRFAAEDAQSAAALLKAAAGVPRNACYLAQQAVEKALKAVLVFEGLPVPRTHDLTLLAVQLPNGWQVAATAADLAILSEWAVAPRYPGDMPEATQGDATAALSLTTGLVDDIVHQFATRGLRL